MIETIAGRLTARFLKPTGATERSENLRELSEEEDMGELSDSPSSRPSHSRPTTPSEPILLGAPRAASDEPYTVSHKAERILGLVPGTLQHAHVSLQHARDEAKRLCETDAGIAGAGASGGGRMDRARKVLSMSMPGKSASADVNMNVVIGAGDEAEQKRRERRRRAADGVLYWQREVARLEAQEQAQTETVKRKDGKVRRRK